MAEADDVADLVDQRAPDNAILGAGIEAVAP